MKLPAEALEVAYCLFLSDGSNGTGFIVRHSDSAYLITAYHVLHNSKGELRAPSLAFANISADLYDFSELKIRLDLKSERILNDKANDISAIYLGKFNASQILDFINLENEQWRPPGPMIISIPGGVSWIKHLNPGEDLFLLTYPTSLGMAGSREFSKTIPIIRKGIIAQIDIKKRILIGDFPSFPGFSGSPVIATMEPYGKQDFAVVGFVSSYIPFETKWRSNRDFPERVEVQNSGLSVIIPIDTIFELLIKDFPYREAHWKGESMTWISVSPFL